jgi:hypothetical protein
VSRPLPGTPQRPSGARAASGPASAAGELRTRAAPPDSDTTTSSSDESSDEDYELGEETAAQLVRAAAPSMRAQRQVQALRSPAARLTRAQFASAVEATEDLMVEARALTTRRGYASVLGQFEQFDETHREVDSWRRTLMPAKIALWLTTMMKRKELQLRRANGRAYARNLLVTSAQKYLIKLRKVYMVSPMFSTAGKLYLDEFGKSLVRMGATIALNQSPPATETHIARARQIARLPSLRQQVTVMWIVAGRSVDARGLKKEDVTINLELEPPEIEFRWPQGVKGTRLDLIDVVLMPRPQAEELQRYLSQVPAGGAPFPHSSEQMSALLRQVDPALRSQSIKRGALHRLLQAGVPLHCIQNKAKHGSATVTRLYLGPRAWAEAHGATEMSLHLWTR